MAPAAAKRGLGKGLGALIPSTPEAQAAQVSDSTGSAPAVVPGAVYAELPIGTIEPNPRQPRSVFDPEALAELVHSIREIGLLQPVVVREVGDHYELIAGERRLRASKEAGLTHIPAIIRATDDDDLLRDALLENLHRSNLNALEEAAAYSQLLADFGCTQEELAQRIGRSRPQVSNTLRLLKLPPDVQRRVAAGVLSAGHARALLSLEDADAMNALAQRIVNEGLSVRNVEEIILLGQGKSKKKSNSNKKSRSDSLQDLVEDVQERLGDALDTRVTVSGMPRSNSRGTIVIEAADAEDLRRIANAIAGPTPRL
ncbi:MAG: ParB/RepB/Spo0J family partition protein [Candidatus Nanopelagicales bacterium]